MRNGKISGFLSLTQALCKVMHINLNDNSNQSYVFDGVVLDQVEVETDLGVCVTANLDWRDNIYSP